MGRQIEEILYNETVRIHNDISYLRSLETILSSNKFRRLWIRSTEEQKNIVIENIRDLNKIHEWIISHPEKDIEEITNRDLKERAKNLGILNWSRLTKGELIRKILEGEARNG